MKYKTLLFDADNTLLDFSRAEYEGLTKTFEELGIPLDDNLRQKYVQLNKSLWRKHELGLIEREDILYQRFDILFKLIGVKIDGRDVEKVYRKYLDEGSFVLDGTKDVLKQLCKTHNLYIVTNGCLNTQQKRLNASGLMPYVKNVFISEEIGFQKPTVEFFDYVIAHISDFRKNDALIIGDSPSSDILGGINAGIDTCLFDVNGNGGQVNIKPTYVIQNLYELFDILEIRALV